MELFVQESAAGKLFLSRQAVRAEKRRTGRHSGSRSGSRTRDAAGGCPAHATETKH